MYIFLIVLFCIIFNSYLSYYIFYYHIIQFRQNKDTLYITYVYEIKTLVVVLSHVRLVSQLLTRVENFGVQNFHPFVVLRNSGIVLDLTFG